MPRILQQLIASAWNRMVADSAKQGRSGVSLGNVVRDGQVSGHRIWVSERRRTEHLAVLGKTGSGKSSLLKHCLLQDIANDHGFVFFDLHGDAQSFVLSAVAEEERKRESDLSRKLIVIEPADLEYSVGVNPLEPKTGQQNFVQIAEVAQVLKARWHLEAFGARTEELLRNGLFVLSENHLTFLELPLLLTNSSFRASCLERVTNRDVRVYFQTRYDRISEGMQAAFREAVLNKVTAFTADPHFRHILGQQRSSFSLVEAMDSECWIVLNLDKGRLGEQALTLGSLFLSRLKAAVFARKSRRLFTLYCDELQNLATFDSGIDTLFSESRKFAVSVVSANQFLDQYPPQLKAALLAVGTHGLFQLSSDDAAKMAQALGGGRQLGERLRYLPHRHLVIKSGHDRWTEAQVPEVRLARTDFSDLYNRCRRRWARRRVEIERDIQARQTVAVQEEEVLDGWN